MRSIDQKQIKEWIFEAGKDIKEALKGDLEVSTKSGPNDLVTNIDRETENFFVNKINKHYPDDIILGEEGLGNGIITEDSRVWIIDPIDGTMNFVKQHNNFCIMIAIKYQEQALCSFIYEVMADKLYHFDGEKTYCNGNQLKNVKHTGLSESLIGINSKLAIDQPELSVLIEKAAGARSMGCAGIEYAAVLEGELSVYISTLAPWDYASGEMMLTNLGGEHIGIQVGAEYYDNKRPLVISGNPKIVAEIKELLNLCEE